MEVKMNLSELPEIGSTSFNQKAAVVWLEQQPADIQSPLATYIFEELLSYAAQPKQSSGSACSKLCGFVENCSKSPSPALNSFAFAQATSIKLFNYFIEWNEQDAHRSMRLVLDYIVSSILWNPDAEISKSIKDSILNDTMSVITLQASRPSTKSSMIAIDHLLQKRVVYLGDVLQVYQHIHEGECEQEALWDSLISRVFAWMELQYVWTAAGKLLVTMLTQPWYQDDKISRHHPNTWHKFILNGLIANHELLEPIKVYIFMPLFKTDPSSTLIYLDKLTSLQKLTTSDNESWDLNGMIWVALLEAGKKTGVVGEPNHGSKHSMGIADHLPPNVLEVLLCHKSHEARASGLSILIASPSTTKPYGSGTLSLLQKYLPSFHEDVDPKIRYDVLGHSRNMIRRLHNSTDTLRKQTSRTSKKSDKKAIGVKEASLTPESEKTTHTEIQQIGKKDGTQSPTDILREHEEFFEWYTYFLKGELVPNASYQRHITALRAMNYFLKSTLVQNDKTSITRRPANLLIDNIWFRSVLDLIMDPYEDVRETATSLMMLLQPGGSMSGPPSQVDGLPSTPLEELRAFSRKANELALKTARADHCDGAARSQQLLCRWSSNFDEAVEVLETIFSGLEQKLYAAEKDLAAAVLKAPVHGDFASLGYIWSSFTGIQLDLRYLATLDGFQDRAISCCQRVWRTVQHILCDDSPEGHLPEELQQIEGLDTKDLLSYSFRAIHESSNLLRTIAQNARHDRKQGFLAPTRQNFEDIGSLTFDELSNLRHRGAFSTVSQTFTACCQLVQCIPAHEYNNVDLLKQWYEGALNCIYTQGSTTRRSAGIPAIVVGILASKTDSPSFNEVIVKLQEIGRQPAFVSETDGSNLAQVHALNCLKDIFKTSFLSHRAEPYLTDCLQLAALSLQSEVWAIRNCGLLLLRSLIDNLFGTNENKLAMEAGWDGRTVRISYHKFEALPSLLVNLLELGKKSSGITMGTQTAEAVFPALDIIRRAGPPEGYLQKLYDIISWYLGSHIWHVREIAARTLCSLLLTSTWLQSIELLITDIGHNSNKLHGALLTIRFLLERLLQVMPDELSEKNISIVNEILGGLFASNNYLYTCTEAQAVYIDILNFIEKTLKIQANWLPGDSGIFSTQQVSGQAPLALLNIRTGQTIVQQALRRRNKEAIDTLDQELKIALTTDINVACEMLEAISSNELPQMDEIRSRLATTYLYACFATKAPEPRTAALEGLASLIDAQLTSASRDSTSSTVPSEETMHALWFDLHQKPVNASLSDAIIRASGPLMAVSLIRARWQVDESLARRLGSWGAMMSDAGLADRVGLTKRFFLLGETQNLIKQQTFDTRIAAVEAINSLATIIRFPANGPNNNSNSQISKAHLPWLLALYDALTDDDVEVREAAAEAAGPILGLALVPVEAGARFLRWLTACFGNEYDFLMHVVGRMIGHNFGSSSFVTIGAIESGSGEANGPGWIPAKAQLTEAMRFDDSLFVVEEHNQYIDEVREAKRWTDVFLSSDSATAKDARGKASQALAEWTLTGLRALTEIAQSESAVAGDGPLGWTSKPQVFAICARILICASALAELKSNLGQAHNQGEENKEKEASIYTDVSEELSRFWNLGRGDGERVHGLLLRMCGIEET
ncbi:putative death-receptor fusion protein-domain-containing protein [Xylaria cf. heliscus]|nr:putative death-receptor fusion protein-domain-containing protein [Xylaria cf. heliscus]